MAELVIRTDGVVTEVFVDGTKLSNLTEVSFRVAEGGNAVTAHLDLVHVPADVAVSDSLRESLRRNAELLRRLPPSVHVTSGGVDLRAP